jgi:hypothetical protein
MADRRPRQFGWSFAVVVGLVLVLFTIAFYYAPGNAQARNMHRVDRYLAAIRPVVAADPRFKLVELSTYTGSDGCLMIHGELDSDADLEALRSIVMQHPCPRPVLWNVWVGPSGAREPRDVPSSR